jgi:hypothetical protein
VLLWTANLTRYKTHSKILAFQFHSVQKNQEIESLHWAKLSKACSVQKKGCFKLAAISNRAVDKGLEKKKYDE